MTTKETVRAILDRLPADCSIDDVLYELYVAQAVARGDADVAGGRTVPHEQVGRRPPQMAAGHRSVVWAESARAAIDDVVTYIAQGSGQAAVRILVATLDTASSLDQHAERGRIVPEMNQPDLRELFVFDYRLLYRVPQMKWSSLLTCMAHATSQPGGKSSAVLATTPSSVTARETT